MNIAENFLMIVKQFADILSLPFNRLLILVTTAQIFSMVVKVFITYIQTKELSLKNMAKYGGMPSSHTAFITSFVFGVAFDPAFGWRHPFFTFSLVLSCIVLIDAVKLRGTIDKLNGVVALLVAKDAKLKKSAKLPKKIAHTTPEVIAGIVFAFLYTILFYTLLYGIFPKQ